MNAINTQKLLKQFPKLYRGYHYPQSKTAMCRGFACQDGWFQIIYTLSASIEKEALKSGISPESDQWPEAIQVKEKFGGLRFYIADGSKEIQTLIRKAGEESLTTCERCGGIGKIIQTEWIKVRCEGCQEWEDARRRKLLPEATRRDT